MKFWCWQWSSGIKLQLIVLLDKFSFWPQLPWSKFGELFWYFSVRSYVIIYFQIIQIRVVWRWKMVNLIDVFLFTTSTGLCYGSFIISFFWNQWWRLLLDITAYLMGVCEGVTSQSLQKNRKLRQKIDSNLCKIWQGKVSQNPFWLLV